MQNVGAKALPLSVSLAIRCELEANTNLDKDRLLKYHKDKLRRLLVGSGKISKTDSMAAQGRINDLFEKPLNPKRAGQLSLLMSD